MSPVFGKLSEAISTGFGFAADSCSIWAIATADVLALLALGQKIQVLLVVTESIAMVTEITVFDHGQFR